LTEQVLNRLQKAFLERATRAYTTPAGGKPSAGDPKEAKIWQLAAELVQEEKRRVFGAPTIEEEQP
jgi:hypothetical protein